MLTVNYVENRRMRLPLKCSSVHEPTWAVYVHKKLGGRVGVKGKFLGGGVKFFLKILL